MVELTPTLLFVLLNIVIATIFFLSSRRPRLSRASSFLSRVTSFGHSELIRSTQPDSATTTPSLYLLSPVSSFSFSGLNQAKHPPEGPSAVSDSSSFTFSGLNQAKHPPAGPPLVSDSSSFTFLGLNQVKDPPAGPLAVSDSSFFTFSGLNQAIKPTADPPAMSDSSSFSFSSLNQAKESSADMPAMSDFSSCMDQTNKELSLMENQEEKCMVSEMTWFKSDMEVDAKADDFINKFKHQLKLQRLESLLRCRNSAN